MIRRAHKVRAPLALSTPSPLAGPSLLLTNIGELVTMRGPARPRVGGEMRELGVLHDAAIRIVNGRIQAVGGKHEVTATPGASVLDLGGKTVVPGFVDAHTHALFAGSREDELEWRAQGLSYREIAARGGGILSTVQRTREASDEEIVRQTRGRLESMLRHGTTTAEVKSGYGLSADQEVRLLSLVSTLGSVVPIDLVPTFLGAHAVPKEYEGRTEAYADLVAGPMLAEVVRRSSVRFCDVWVEEGYFTADHGRRILREAKRLGLDAKVHADELTASGGAELAADAGAVSADHLIHSTTSGLRELAAKRVVAVLLPGTSSSSTLPYADARRCLQEGLAVALGTDLSPASWIESMQTVLWLATHHSGLTAAEALTAATVNAAYALGRGFEVGSIEEGKRADLVVLDVPNHRHLGYRHGNAVEMVLQAGRIVSRRTSTGLADR